ncbi:hypothetical protein DEJ13_08475 [Curtobacterium sp. MCLR17_007]|uniref:hypothetical protein n=1 Tax=Curtobacterium sp. MCLR17_007 TaxID=2175648 RepID=UPI0011B4EB17|nr:hypothetical protein [Curtobacterium sp. MCLR17_007]WIB61852.1 hypothetical protein DEJ13_08475 [Curtobacterium sp. MCLR17_007]
MDSDGERAARVMQLRRALQAAQPGSVASLRGSLAEGTADAWSDIDLSWRVSVGDDALKVLPHALEAAGRVESLRLDPELDPDRRLVFVRFRDWSLFQRVDLDVVGSFHGGRATWDRGWSRAESALMNAVAAIRASHRRRGDIDGLVKRGLERVGAPDPGGALTDRLSALIDAAVAADPAQTGLAQRVYAEVFALGSANR